MKKNNGFVGIVFLTSLVVCFQFIYSTFLDLVVFLISSYEQLQGPKARLQAYITKTMDQAVTKTYSR
jgi:hypothetical protein